MTVLLLFVLVLVIILIVASYANSASPSFTISDNSLRKVLKQRINISFDMDENNPGKYFIFDCETTGLPRSRYASIDELENWPHIVQISWAVFINDEKMVCLENHILKQNVKIPYEATSIHGITNADMRNKGKLPGTVFSKLIEDLKKAEIIVAHNINFDLPILRAELLRNKFMDMTVNMPTVCTMESSTYLLQLPSRRHSGFKYPKLSELYGFLFYRNINVSLGGLHDAETDMLLTAKSFFELRKRKEIDINYPELSAEEDDLNYTWLEEIKVLEKTDPEKAIREYERMLKQNLFQHHAYARLEILHRKLKNYVQEIKVCDAHLEYMKQTSSFRYKFASHINRVKERKGVAKMRLQQSETKIQ